MSATPAEARIEQLEAIEEDVINILKTGGNCLLEIAKDRPSQKAVDTNVQQVLLLISYAFFNLPAFFLVNITKMSALEKCLRQKFL